MFKAVTYTENKTNKGLYIGHTIFVYKKENAMFI